MIRILKFLIITLFAICIIGSILIMIDNYKPAVVRNISQTIICDEVKSTYQGSGVSRTIQTCFTYNPQLLFYGQFLIIALLIITFKYVYSLVKAFIIKYESDQVE